MSKQQIGPREAQLRAMRESAGKEPPAKEKRIALAKSVTKTEKPKSKKQARR